jgi:L-arabinose isomerase
MKDLNQFEVWFLTGSQHLYGEETLEKVAEDSKIIAEQLDRSEHMPVSVVFKPVMTTADSIRHLVQEANAAETCVGLITWMHTFSPAKMWITGLKTLHKPFVHLHTQFNREIPWSEIDMDYMNLHQSAHGDREFGFIGTRMRLNRKVVVGYWEDEWVQKELGDWTRVACAWHDWQHLRVARFGDNMRDVAVTEGDKVSAEMQFGYSVSGFGVGDLVKSVKAVGEDAISDMVADYLDTYQAPPSLQRDGGRHTSLREAARIEVGLRQFLEAGGFKAFTTTFEDLYGLAQLPGLAVQRLMADGYGFGAEGDWKTAALVRAMKVMSTGKPKGTTFMEDYTYHFSETGDKVLGAHMLEICESIAENKPTLEILPLSIGGKADPVRLIFDAKGGEAVAASLVDLGTRFRLIVNEVNVVPTDEPLPKLPVARAFWLPKPDLKTAAHAWVLAGGAHHTSFSFDVTPQQMEDFAEIAGIEYLLINEKTNIHDFKKELRWNEAYYYLSKGFI